LIIQRNSFYKSMFLALAFLFGLAVAQCPLSDKYCGRCLGSVCYTCYASAFNGTACVPPVATIDNCQTYNTSGSCLSCITGYYIDANKKCVKITDDSCYAYDIVNKCTACKNSIRSVNGTCTDTTKKCNDANCNICDSSNLCLVCKSGFIFDQSKKCTAGTGISNCSNFGPVTCNSCDYGYYYNNGTCVAASYNSDLILNTLFVGLLSALLNFA